MPQFVLVWLLIGANIVSLVLRRSHQTLYDQLAGTYVVAANEGKKSSVGARNGNVYRDNDAPVGATILDVPRAAPAPPDQLVDQLDSEPAEKDERKDAIKGKRR